MTRVVIVGEIYNADLSIGGGPIYPPPGSPPGYWGGVAPPHPSHPIAPGGQPPGYWGGVAPPHPDQGLPGAPPGYWGGVAPPHPDQGLPPAGGTEVPPDVYTPAPIPEEIASQVVVSVYDPKTTNWTTKSYPPR
jgi:hypothetical protein